MMTSNLKIECYSSETTCNAVKDHSSENTSVSKFFNQETEDYRHAPETELADLVCHACHTGQYAHLQDYLGYMAATDPTKINESDSAGMTALHFAVSCGSLVVVNILASFGADVEKQDALGFTPLFLATGRYPNVEIARYLLKNSPSGINLQTKTGATPLHGAALQDNINCIRLLLEKGADPRIDDEDGTTPLELTRSDQTRYLLHEYIINSDNKRDTLDAVCTQCKQIPKQGFKRCGACHVTLYCSKKCQVADWKFGGHRTNCPGSLIACPYRVGEDPLDNCVQISFHKVLGSNKPNIKVFRRSARESIQKAKFLEKKRFVVKVQLPLEQNTTGEMMVYNVDRSVEGYVYPYEPGYKDIQKVIRCEGYRGIKAFFWAELADLNKGTLRIFKGKSAPYQTW